MSTGSKKVGRGVSISLFHVNRIDAASSKCASLAMHAATRFMSFELSPSFHDQTPVNWSAGGAVDRKMGVLYSTVNDNTELVIFSDQGTTQCRDKI